MSILRRRISARTLIVSGLALALAGSAVYSVLRERWEINRQRAEFHRSLEYRWRRAAQPWIEQAIRYAPYARPSAYREGLAGSAGKLGGFLIEGGLQDSHPDMKFLESREYLKVEASRCRDMAREYLREAQWHAREVKTYLERWW